MKKSLIAAILIAALSACSAAPSGPQVGRTDATVSSASRCLDPTKVPRIINGMKTCLAPETSVASYLGNQPRESLRPELSRPVLGRAAN